jgi:membrane protease YdiL (CAAX protease family)
MLLHNFDIATAKQISANASGLNVGVVALLALTLFPAVIIWFGLYVLQSAVWTLAIYHFLYLIPVIAWGWPLWRNTLRRPTMKELAITIIPSLLFAAVAAVFYRYCGDFFLNSQNTFDLLMRLGYRQSIFIPLSIYFIFVNSALEELFWRGVVYNKMRQFDGRMQHLAIIWSSAAYAVLHYPIMRLVLFPGWAEFGTVLLALHGAALAIVYRRTRSIPVASLCHAFHTDFTAIVLIAALFCRLHMAALL